MLIKRSQPISNICGSLVQRLVHCFGAIWQPCAIYGNPARSWPSNDLDGLKIAVKRFLRLWRDMNRIASLSIMSRPLESDAISDLAAPTSSHARIEVLSTDRPTDFELLQISARRSPKRRNSLTWTSGENRYQGANWGPLRTHFHLINLNFICNNFFGSLSRPATSSIFIIVHVCFDVLPRAEVHPNAHFQPPRRHLNFKT